MEWQVLIEIVAKVTLAGVSADQSHRHAVALTCVGELAREQELGKFRNKARATSQTNKPRGSEATAPLALFEEQVKLGVRYCSRGSTDLRGGRGRIPRLFKRKVRMEKCTVKRLHEPVAQ
jgi:hypothetical protein